MAHGFCQSAAARARVGPRSSGKSKVDLTGPYRLHLLSLPLTVTFSLPSPCSFHRYVRLWIRLRIRTRCLLQGRSCRPARRGGGQNFACTITESEVASQLTDDSGNPTPLARTLDQVPRFSWSDVEMGSAAAGGRPAMYPDFPLDCRFRSADQISGPKIWSTDQI